MRKFLIVSIIMLLCFVAKTGYAANTDVDNLVQSWIQVGQGITQNFGGGDRLQTLPNIPNTSNPGTPTFVPGQMPGQHPNFTGKEYFQFIGARLVTKKEEVSGQVAKVWDFSSVRPYFDAFALQAYIDAGKKKAKYSITATWPKELELGVLPATIALPETGYDKFDLVHVSVFAIEGDNAEAGPFYLLAQAHEKARLAGFHLVLLEQGGYHVNQNGSKGFSFTIGGSGIPSSTSGIAGGIGPYVNSVTASTPVIPWFKFEVVAPREQLEAKKAKLRINTQEKKYSVIFGKKFYENGEEGAGEIEKKYVPISPSEIVPLPLKKEREKVLPIPETPKKEEPKPAPTTLKEELKPAPVPVPEVKKPEPKPEPKSDMDELESRAEKAAGEIRKVQEEATKMVEGIEQKAESFKERLEKIKKIAVGTPAIKGVKMPQLTIRFEFDKAILRPSEFPKIMELAKWLKQNPAVKAQTEGHASFEGTEKYNASLSYERSKVVYKQLLEYGVSADQIQFVALGKSRPTGDPDVSKDRRVILRLIGESSGK